MSSRANGHRDARSQKPLCVVTGASTGLGRAIALQLARAGYAVLAGVRQPAAQSELDALGMPELWPIRLDVTSDADVLALVERVQAERARGYQLQAVVNNAALCESAPLELQLPDSLRAHFEVNVVGVQRVLQGLLPALLAAQGRVVNIGSNVARVAPPFLGSYAASKAALETLTDVLRRELHGSGVQVSLIVPGPVLTPVWDKIAASVEAVLARADAGARERYARRLQRFVALNQRTAERSRLRSEDVARAVERILRARSPRPRYELGVGAIAGTWISRTVPTRLLDSAIARALDVAPEPAR